MEIPPSICLENRRDKRMKIAILTPSRGRPKGFLQLVQSTLETCSGYHQIEHYCYLDWDDASVVEYNALLSNYPQYSEQVMLTVNEPQSVSKSWNVLANEALKNGANIIIVGNDDLIYRTENWDLRLVEEFSKFKDNIVCMWFEDGINSDQHCAFPIVSEDWIRTVGYLTPGMMNFGYNDTWIFDIAKLISRTHFIGDVLTEHMHFSLDKSEFDETYQRHRTMEAGNMYKKDEIIFNNTLFLRHIAAEKLANVISSAI